jgi:ATP-binding cassette subfamily B (MDR/TAP) protein 1
MAEKSNEQIKEPLLQGKSDPLVPNSANNNEQPTKLVSILGLFRYADRTDKIHLVVGTICSIAAGCSFPFFMIFFGDILPVFLEPNRDHAASSAFDVALKFFIIGGATWILSNILKSYNLGFIGLYSWNQSGSNQSLRFKKMYYKTLLDQ